jgi:FkbM family methyltransferase
MNASSRIRHSFVGKAVRKGIHTYFQARFAGGDPLKYRLAGDLTMRLYPEGEIAEFLAFPWLFEPNELKLVARLLQPGMSVIDVGANIGLYSILAAMRTGPNGRVWAFEPSSESSNRLERNLRLNNCNTVEVVRLALSDTISAASLISDQGFGDAYRYVRADAPPSDGEVVKVTTLDAWAAANSVGPIDFLKVDIEGGEYKMFLGAKEFLSSSPGLVIMFECERDWSSRAGWKPEDLFEFMKSLGLKLFAWQSRSGQWTDSPDTIASSGTLWATRNRSYLPPPALD